ncbi:hypothetical protein JF535_04280 [Microbulbifer salipaludis]|uniref:Uncharacterized protein n=1 Tax=Microbulbifer salipaludis TaxID=187980 RepID=A0ABS3E486_9GAMM|nr:hypothetical protein [Microbulbifer salipaludis]MBN8430067.1 hypothetical protein [Microbulbifer salipaludis]
MKKSDFEAGLRHINRWLHPDSIEKNIANFRRLRSEGAGKESGPLLILISTFKARALFAWFHDHNLTTAKLNAYIAARLRILYAQTFPSRVGGASSSYLFYPLLSDCNELIHWESQYFVPLFNSDDGHYFFLDPKTCDFQSLQFRLAMAGDWEILGERAEIFLSQDVEDQRRFRADNQLYLALAKNDSEGVSCAMQSLLSPKLMKARNNEQQWGQEARLVSAWGFMFAKLARIHGFSFDVDKDSVPIEWIPESPLAAYDDTLEPLKESEIYDAFRVDASPSVNNVSLLSPRPPEENSLTIRDVIEIVDS